MYRVAMKKYKELKFLSFIIETTPSVSHVFDGIIYEDDWTIIKLPASFLHTTKCAKWNGLSLRAARGRIEFALWEGSEGEKFLPGSKGLLSEKLLKLLVSKTHF